MLFRQGYIVFDVNGTKHTVYINQIFATAIGDKQYFSTFDGLKVGEYTATVTYSGDSKYETITNSTQFKVVKGNLEDDLKVEIINDTVGNVTLNITLPGDATGNITIKIGNKTYNGTIENGSAIIKLPDTPVGNHTIEIIYPGDDNYNPTNKTMNITVDKVDINPDDIKTEVLKNTYGNVTIKVSVLENATGNITVTINNQTFTGNLVNGSAIIKLENVIAGNNTAIITYSGDENYNPVTKEEIIEVVKKRLNPDDINVTIGNNTYGNVTVNVTVPGDATGNITITIGNETYIAPIVNGSAIIELPDVPAGDYNMTIKYPGDDNYEEITLDKNLTINKNTLNPDYIKVTIENNTEGNVVIKVTAPEGVTGNITLVIDGKEYTVELVNGTATFIITDIPAGIYNIQVIYSGDNNYNGFTKNLTLEIIAKNNNSTTANNTINNNNNSKNITQEISNPNSLENIKTANPIALLLLVLLAIPLRRRKVD